MNHIIMGGLEKVLLQYLDVLSARGFKCTVLSKEKITDSYFLDFFNEHDIKVVELKKIKTHSHLKKSLQKCLRWIKFHRCICTNDVIVDFANFSFSNELKGVKKQKIGYCHGSILFFNSIIIF